MATLNAANGKVFGLYQERGFRRRASKTLSQQVKVAHPLMLLANAAGKKKNDQIDASKIADCLGCDFLPECHMARTQIRDRRRTLRYRHLLVRPMVQMKNRISGLLRETGGSHKQAEAATQWASILEGHLTLPSFHSLVPYLYRDLAFGNPRNSLHGEGTGSGTAGTAHSESRCSIRLS